MVTSINSLSAQNPAVFVSAQYSRISVEQTTVSFSGDVLDLGRGGQVSQDEAMGVLYERAMAKLQGVVDDARAQLGLAEGAVLDTSPEATAGRIADFALGFFDQWRANDDARGALGDEEARQQFADFIGGAISQGIEEARGILGALSALSPEIEGNIDSTATLIRQRLDDFVMNG